MFDDRISPQTAAKTTTSLDQRVSRITRFLFACIVINTVALVAMYSVQASFLGPRSDRTYEALKQIRTNAPNALGLKLAMDTWLVSNSADDLVLVEGARRRLSTTSAVVDAINPDSAATTELLTAMQRASDQWLTNSIDVVINGGETFVPGTPEHAAFAQQNAVLWGGYFQLFQQAIVEFTGLTQTIAKDQRRLLSATILSCGVFSIAGAGVGIYRSRKLCASFSPPLRDLVQRIGAIQRRDEQPQTQSSLADPAEFQLLRAGLDDLARSLRAADLVTKRRFEKVDKHSQREAELIALNREMSASHGLTRLLEAVCHRGKRTADGATTTVWLTNSENNAVVAVTSSDASRASVADGATAVFGEGDIGKACEVRATVSRSATAEGLDASLAVPMITDTQVIGVLEFTGSAVAKLDREAMADLDTMATQIAGAIETVRVYEQTVELALTDSLTLVPNRRCFDRDLALACAASAEDGSQLALLMLDIDHFKAYNEIYGHELADLAITELAVVLQSKLRETDHVYRYGDDEFAFILHRTTSSAATNVAESVLSAIRSHFSRAQHREQIKASIGVATLDQHGPAPETLVSAADTALSKAKDSGRDLVCKAGTRVTTLDS